MPADPALTAAIAAGIAQYLRENPPQPGVPGPPGPPGPPGSNAVSDSSTQQGTRWNQSDLGFFDPMYDSKSVSTGSAIEHVGKETYFRDVHLFIERARQLCILKDSALVRANLWLSLHGTALEWWTSGELNDAEQRIVAFGDNIDEWSRILLKRFRQPSNIAIDAILRERYTMKDAANHREPREFAAKMLRSAKDAGLSGVKVQLDIIFNAIDLELRRDIRRPNDHTSANDFLSDLDDRKHEWWAYASRNRPAGSLLSSRPNRPPYESRPAWQYGQYQPPNRVGYQQPYRPPGFQPNSNAYGSAYGNARPPFQPSYQGNQAYPYTQQQQPAFRPNAPQILPPIQKLQITEGLANGLDSRQTPRPLQPSRPGQGNKQSYRPWDNRQRFPPPQRAYQASAEDIPDDITSEGNKNDPGESWQYHAYGERTAHEGTDGFHANVRSEHEHNDSLEEQYQEHEVPDVNFIAQSKEDYRCSTYKATFASRNKLFAHLREQCWKPKKNLRKLEIPYEPPVPETSSVSNENPVCHVTKQQALVESTVIPDQSKAPGYGFRGWKYATVSVHWSESSDAEETDICLDTGCSVTLIDRMYLEKVLPHTELRRMSSPMPVRGVGNKIVKTDEYASVKMFVNGMIDGMPSRASIIMEVHVVDDLKANILVGNDTLKPQGVVIDFRNDVVVLGACQNLTAPIAVHTRVSPNAKRTIKTKAAVTVPPGTTIQVPVAYKGSVPADRDFLFEPECAQDLGVGGVFAHVVDSTLSFVQVHNASPIPVRLPRKARLGSLVEYNQDGAYLVTPSYAPMAAGNSNNNKSWKARLATGIITVAAAYNGMTKAAILSHTLSTAIDPALEHILPNGITVYGSPEVAEQFAAAAADFPEI